MHFHVIYIKNNCYGFKIGEKKTSLEKQIRAREMTKLHFSDTKPNKCSLHIIFLLKLQMKREKNEWKKKNGT